MYCLSTVPSMSIQNSKDNSSSLGNPVAHIPALFNLPPAVPVLQPITYEPNAWFWTLLVGVTALPDPLFSNTVYTPVTKFPSNGQVKDVISG